MLNLLLPFLFWFIALLLASFAFWVRLEQELSEETIWVVIFKSTIWTLFTGRIIWWLWQLTNPQWQINWLWKISEHPGIDIWGSILGGIIILKLNKRISKNFISEIGDAWIEAYALAITVLIISNWSKGLLLPLISIIGLSIWYLLRKYYRKFSWYPSGKVGFCWWTGIALLSIAQIIWLYLQSGDLIIAKTIYFLVPLIISIMGIYKLSGRNNLEDIHALKKTIRVRITVIKQKFRHKRKKI